MFERDKFVDDEGEPLSDHDPLAVDFRWTFESKATAQFRTNDPDDPLS